MSHPPLIAALLAPAAYPHPAASVRLIETHISWVLIAGDYAYKLKKPVDLGFLDFGSLAKRRHFCEEELRLNRRLAPDIYLEVVPVTGSIDAPRMGGTGPALEYAVRMRAFPPDATLDKAPEIGEAQIDAIAEAVARFHRDIERAPPESDYGTPEAVMRPVRENFAQIRALEHDAEPLQALDALERWSEAEGSRLAPTFAGRRREGFVRDCHGDLHLGNIAWVDEKPLIFDCIEFNPALRCIDVASEMAFLVMDLMSRGRNPHPSPLPEGEGDEASPREMRFTALAWRCLNRYLEHTGDYAGLAVFRFYLVYRALVRAKVARIRAAQTGGEGGEAFPAHLRLAQHLAAPGRPALLLMHGVSGTGKTWFSQRLLGELGAVRLRSDVERKRLFGLGPFETSASALGAGIYTEAATARTFERLERLAEGLLEAGCRVIVDATFLRRELREAFRRLALRRQAEFRILDMRADEHVLRSRVGRRAAARLDVSEATLEVLEAQAQRQDPLAAGELEATVVFDAADQEHWPHRIEALKRAL